MEKSKFTMVGIIVLLSIGLIVACVFKSQNLKDSNRTNWQWSNDWNSNQIKPPMQQPNQPQPNQNQPNQPQVAQNFEQAKQMSQSSGKPILALFGAAWCHWCKKMEQETLTNDSVRNVVSNYVYIKIDTDTNKNLVNQYKIRGLPTTLIIDSSGKEIKKEAGFMDADKMQEFLK